MNPEAEPDRYPQSLLPTLLAVLFGMEILRCYNSLVKYFVRASYFTWQPAATGCLFLSFMLLCQLNKKTAPFGSASFFYFIGAFFLFATAPFFHFCRIVSFGYSRNAGSSEAINVFHKHFMVVIFLRSDKSEIRRHTGVDIIKRSVLEKRHPLRSGDLE